MNIDYLANLIESSDVSTFRTLATYFLRSIGYSRGFFSDGPYDGGVDFFIHQDKAAGVLTGFQLSVESKWKVKLEKEIKKCKTNYPEMRSFVFVSKRRIPLHSMRKLNTSLVQQYGIGATHYDNQAIATEFIDKNLVGKLYEALGIAPPPTPPQAFVTPKAEAASALLLFGTETGDFRAEMTQNLVFSELRNIQPASEGVLATAVMSTHALEEPQRAEVLRAIRHSAQLGLLKREGAEFVLSQEIKSQQDGLKALASGEFEALRTRVRSFMDGISPGATSTLADEVLENLLILSTALWRRSAPHPATQPSDVDDVFHKVSSSLNAALGQSLAKRALSDLAKIVAESDFAKRIAAAELYYSLVQTPSSQLVTALGGTKGLMVVFDTPVLIPLLCGLLFDRVEDHAGYSAQQLIALLRQHRFTAIAPNRYIEETAAHLIDCCRNYQSVLLAGEDLSFSSNAFASHYSQLKKTESNSALSYDDYIATFGAPAGARFTDLTDEFFYSTRDRIASCIANLLVRYSVEPLDLDNRKFENISQRISKTLAESGISRAQVLIEHDARVIGYLESTAVAAGFAKVLCTWDSLQLRLNPTWDSYCVMNPASVTDTLTLLRAESSHRPMAQLVDFVWLQTETAVRLSAQVWDEIVAIEKGNLADAMLLAKARKFRQSYITNHKDDADFDATHISSLWLKWKQSNN